MGHQSSEFGVRNIPLNITCLGKKKILKKISLDLDYSIALFLQMGKVDHLKELARTDTLRRA